jgi:multiple antibiotic resistance protein
MSLFSLTLTFFLILDSVGHISDFNFFLKDLPEKRQKIILFREMLIALGFLVAFHYFGDFLMATLHVSPATIRIAGGLVLFLIASKMIFPSHTRQLKAPKHGEPFIVPLAIPMIAGPSILATVMFHASTEPAGSTRVLFAIGLAWSLSVATLWICWRFREVINSKALEATERLMGLVLTLLAIEMFLKGLKLFLTA